MVRITPVDDGGGRRVLKVEGKLIGPWVEELRRAVGEAAGRPGFGGLDLGRVTFADAAGLAALGELVRAGVPIVAASAFIRSAFEQEVA